MGTALRNLVKERKAKSAPISGKGRLSDPVIKKLTAYYGNAIKKNTGDLVQMRKAVWSSFFHTISTDEDPHHGRCPSGEDSWCFFQRAIARNEEPRPHSKALPREICEALVPTYKRLGSDALLGQCLDGKTSNINESFHSVVWKLVPKMRWSCKRTVETAVALCVQQYNKGSSTLLDILMDLNLVSSRNVNAYIERKDFKRVAASNRKSTEKARIHREVVDMARRKENQERRQREGVVYAAGAF